MKIDKQKMRWDRVAADRDDHKTTRRIDFNVPSPPEVEAFLTDIFAVCRKHQLSIAHEDGHGAFLIEEFKEYNLEWLDEAALNIRKAGE